MSDIASKTPVQKNKTAAKPGTHREAHLAHLALSCHKMPLDIKEKYRRKIYVKQLSYAYVSHPRANGHYIGTTLSKKYSSARPYHKTPTTTPLFLPASTNHTIDPSSTVDIDSMSGMFAQFVLSA
ncbi:495_t:CDS:2 [Rhizophagus irregularis]|nr:495_t:CDS:2 [Rhizophagus irregularis]